MEYKTTEEQGEIDFWTEGHGDTLLQIMHQSMGVQQLQLADLMVNCITTEEDDPSAAEDEGTNYVSQPVIKATTEESEAKD